MTGECQAEASHSGFGDELDRDAGLGAQNLAFIAARRQVGTFREFEANATIQLDNFHEIPGLIDLAERIGSDCLYLYMIQNTGTHLVRDYDRKNVADVTHPRHLAFLETLRDPRLDRPIVHMYDVATWRDMAFATGLPSDDLAADFTREDLYAAIAGSLVRQDRSAATALCVAGRIRFPEDHELLRIEADALEMLGFARQGDYRRAMAAAIEHGAAPARPSGYRRAVDRIDI